MIRKIRLIPNFVTSQPGQQIILKHILPNISRSKGNQTIEFGQLLEYSIRNLFGERSYTKCGGITSPRPFSGKLKSRISLDQKPKILYSLFLLYPKLRDIDIY